VVTLSLFAGAGGASAATPISKILPDQQFVGLVNGYTQNATIKMACFGPVRPDQQGHPFAGQWAEVLKAEVIRNFGYTGSLGTSIVADFPGTGVTPQRLTFSSYGVTETIPTTWFFPCSGPGTVVFSPQPTSPTAKSFTVTVNFVGQPAAAQAASAACTVITRADSGKTFLMSKQSCDLLELTDTGGIHWDTPTVSGDSIHLEPLPIASPVAGQFWRIVPDDLGDSTITALGHPICPTPACPQYVVLFQVKIRVLPSP
jgi:hypothetical protein